MTLYLVVGVGAAEAAAALRAPAHQPAAAVSSDATDAEWAVLASLVPAGRPGHRGGRPFTPRRCGRDPVRGHNGGVWRALPADFPPWKTVHDYHSQWCADGTVNRIHNMLREQVRATEGRHRQPSAAIVDFPVGTRCRDAGLRQPRLRRG